MAPLKRDLDPASISELTINRLSIYLRCLQELERLGIDTVSSQELERRFNLNSAQIRKDLAYFGEFGIRGVGYNVAELKHHIQAILGLDRERRVVIVGAGNLGTALCHHKRFASEAFLIVAILDSDPAKVGRPIPGGLLVESSARLAEIVAQREAEIGVITTPPSAAQAVADQMVSAGLRAILNFAPVQVKAPEGVRVRTVDLKVYLEELSFYLAHGT